jgi:hypothetical protein
MLHRPREQELLQVPPARPVNLPPAEMGGDIPQVIGPGLLAGTVAAQLADRDPQLLRSRATAAAGAAFTSSGTYPSHGSVHSFTAVPITFSLPRNFRTNSSPAGARVKYLISSARAGSGNPRSCASSSSENTSLVATGASSPEDQTPTENT